MFFDLQKSVLLLCLGLGNLALMSMWADYYAGQDQGPAVTTAHVSVGKSELELKVGSEKIMPLFPTPVLAGVQIQD